MKIKYIDGSRLKQAIIAGSSVIDQMQENLNKINVFPIPDRDTGTNMASTMNQVSYGLLQCSQKSVGAVSLALAESALLGAQGCSGVILAQFFNGFANAVTGKLKLSTTAFADAVKKAKDAAHDAIADPTDGTILTVMKDWAAHIDELCHKTSDFVEILQKSLQTAQKSLAETPQKLKVLAKAGVVDAGAQGFVHLLEGISNFIEKGKFAINEKISAKTLKPQAKIDTNIKYKYCTEYTLVSDSITPTQIKQTLYNLGDSIVIAHTNSHFRVHIHTNEPQQVLEILNKFGTIEFEKIDDMATSVAEYQDIAIIVDSACDLPYNFLKDNKVFIVPTKLAFGSETYRDKIDISPSEFYKKLVHSKVHPSTSQPALASFKQVYEEVAEKYESAISIHLPRVLSGTLQGAENAANLYGQNKITCIDGKTVSVALGLIVMEAIEAVKAGDSIEQIIEKTKTATENVHLFVSISTIDYMIKGGRISKQKGLLAKVLHLKPIIFFNKLGKAEAIAKGLGEKAAMKKTLKLAIKKAEEYRQIKFMVTHANAHKKAEWFVEQLKKVFDVQEIPIVDAAPVLGVHAGPGTAAIGLLGFK